MPSAEAIARSTGSVIAGAGLGELTVRGLAGSPRAPRGPLRRRTRDRRGDLPGRPPALGSIARAPASSSASPGTGPRACWRPDVHDVGDPPARRRLQTERKYYAPGVGEIAERVVKGHHEAFQLVGVTH
jgi:hypothetical protein